MLTRKIRLLIIDDDVVDRRALARAVRALGDSHELVEAQNGRIGMELAAAQPFDCILLDYNLPDMNGLDLLGALREQLGVTTPIVVMTGSGNESIAVEAMKRGAQDYLPKSQLEPATLARVVGNAIDKSALQKELTQTQQNLKRLALYDALTGLGNRNLYNIEIARSVAIAKRKGTSFVLLMLDLDKFKAVNDEFGHEAGDAVLVEIGSRLRQIARASDVYFRIGGDEFTAILDSGSDGSAVAERITVAVAMPISFEQHQLAVAVSIGMAHFPVDGRSVNDLIRVADEAMYNAKKSDLGWAAAKITAAK